MLPIYEALLEVMVSNPLSTLKKLHLDLHGQKRCCGVVNSIAILLLHFSHKCQVSDDL